MKENLKIKIMQLFSRDEFLQTIDMNQEGYFEEALKLRNTLQEFGIREGPLPMTILGLREHIFTGSVSSLANYFVCHPRSPRFDKAFTYAFSF